MADVDLLVCRVEGAPLAISQQQTILWVCNTPAGGHGQEKPGDGDFNWSAGTHRKKTVFRYPFTHASSWAPRIALPGMGFETAWRGGAAVWSEPADPQAIEQCRQNRFSKLPRRPQHRSSDMYLAQLDGLAWCARSIIIQTGIWKATRNARDCARVRWQFAGWGPALQSAGQQVTSRDSSSSWAGEGCARVRVFLLCLLTVFPWVSPFHAGEQPVTKQGR